MSHRCPKTGCDEIVSDGQLACRPHWYSIPKPLRNAVWRAWNHGKGAGSNEHWAAISAAIEALNRG